MRTFSEPIYHFLQKREKARLEKLQSRPVRVITEEQREETYRRWVERKRIQAERQKADAIVQQSRVNDRIERERKKNERQRQEKLAEWVRKKEDDMKS